MRTHLAGTLGVVADSGRDRAPTSPKVPGEPKVPATGSMAVSTTRAWLAHMCECRG
jgi:hypothetical protein